MTIEENPSRVAEELGKRDNCLKFLMNVTIVIACHAEAEYNVRHCRNTANVFTEAEINTSKEMLTRQATTRLLNYYIRKGGNAFTRILASEKNLHHDCSCIFTKLGDVATHITKHHPISCNIDYMGDVEKLRKTIYESIMKKYKKMFLNNDDMTTTFFEALTYVHKNRKCVGHANAVKLAETCR